MTARRHGRFAVVTPLTAAHTGLSVQAFRDHLRQHRTVAAWLLTLALLLKVIVPGGYMLDTSGGSVGLILCSGMAPAPVAPSHVMAMPGMAHHAAHDTGHDKKDGHSAEQPCAFSGLNAVSLAATDPILLALAIAFVIALVFRQVSQKPVQARAYLRPPLRGPPLHL